MKMVARMERMGRELVTDSNQSVAADIAVRLTPTQAKHIADTIRIELVSQWDCAWFTSLPCREDAGRARSLLEVCTDQLEELEWGEATGTVELHSGSDRLESIADNLLEGAEECLADTDHQSKGRFQHSRERSNDMIAAARVIREALERHSAPTR
jgi:hypothetical protein